jgi:hypothetical protein
MNSPAATAVLLSDLCTLARIEPRSSSSAPKGSDPIRAATVLTQGGPSGHRLPSKPKGMHWRTYDAICERLEIEEAGLDLNLILAMAKLVRS